MNLEAWWELLKDTGRGWAVSTQAFRSYQTAW